MIVGLVLVVVVVELIVQVQASISTITISISEERIKFITMIPLLLVSRQTMAER